MELRKRAPFNHEMHGEGTYSSIVQKGLQHRANKCRVGDAAKRMSRLTSHDGPVESVVEEFQPPYTPNPTGYAPSCGGQMSPSMAWSGGGGGTGLYPNPAQAPVYPSNSNSMGMMNMSPSSPTGGVADLVSPQGMKCNITVKAPSILPSSTTNPLPAIPSGVTGKDWRSTLGQIRNQGQCGSCWAFGTAEMLAGRLDSASNGAYRDYSVSHGDSTGGWFSVQYLLSCLAGHPNQMGCQGSSDVEHAVLDVSLAGNSQGLPLNKDYPYKDGSLGETSQTGPCMTLPSTDVRVPFVDAYAVSGPQGTSPDVNNARVKQEVYWKGPTLTAIQVFPSFEAQNFSSSPSNPYSPQQGEQSIGGHAVNIVGWGVVPPPSPSSPAPQGAPAYDPTNPYWQYWIMRNSWGSDWGDQGYWYQRMSDNMSGIAANAVGGTPDYNNAYVKQAIGTITGPATTIIAPGAPSTTSAAAMADPPSSASTGWNWWNIVWIILAVLIVIVLVVLIAWLVYRGYMNENPDCVGDGCE